jgi:hypothetical protein
VRFFSSVPLIDSREPSETYLEDCAMKSQNRFAGALLVALLCAAPTAQAAAGPSSAGTTSVPEAGVTTTPQESTLQKVVLELQQLENRLDQLVRTLIARPGTRIATVHRTGLHHSRSYRPWHRTARVTTFNHAPHHVAAYSRFVHTNLRHPKYHHVSHVHHAKRHHKVHHRSHRHIASHNAPSKGRQRA